MWRPSLCLAACNAGCWHCRTAASSISAVQNVVCMAGGCVQSKVRMAFKKCYADANISEPTAAQVAEGMSRHSNLGNAAWAKANCFKCIITMREAIHDLLEGIDNYSWVISCDFPNLRMILTCTNCWVEMVCLTIFRLMLQVPRLYRLAQPMLSMLAMPWWRPWPTCVLSPGGGLHPMSSAEWHAL